MEKQMECPEQAGGRDLQGECRAAGPLSAVWFSTVIKN